MKLFQERDIPFHRFTQTKDLPNDFVDMQCVFSKGDLRTHLSTVFRELLTCVESRTVNHVYRFQVWDLGEGQCRVDMTCTTEMG